MDTGRGHPAVRRTDSGSVFLQRCLQASGTMRAPRPATAGSADEYEKPHGSRISVSVKRTWAGPAT